ncbi:putative ribonuclease H-like domain-containing protein [Tanacetum coccineum]
MNYEPVTAGNQTNKNAGIKDNVNAVPTQQYILLPLLYDSPQSSKDAIADDAGGASNKEDDQNMQDFRAELDNLLVQQKEGYANSTKKDSTISLSVSTAGQSFTNVGDLPTDSLMPDLEDIADLLNTEFIRIINVQFIGDKNSATQTRRMTKISEELAMIEAMQEELLQCKLQKVWTLVDLPKGKSAIGTKIEAIRLFLAYASFMGFIVYQMDVKSAFLYGTIEEEEKGLYGLLKLLKPGNETLSPHLLENGFRRGIIDKTLFIKKNQGDILLVQVYVDDIIFGSTKKSLCTEFESLMHKKFQMSSMGELTFFLGLQVMQRDDGIFISQDKYMADILKKFDFVIVKAASTPIETNKALNKDEEAEDVDVHLYRSMIGSLMYLTASRPDIMFAVCACARFQVTPKTSHLHAVKRIFRYLKGQSKLGLWYPRDSPFDLEAFSDSDYAGASLDRKSTTGGCQFLGKRLISWQCKKQTIVANSTTEAEYVAAANCCGQMCLLLIWFGDGISDEFGVKTGSCKVNAARQDLVLFGEIEGKGSGQPSEPQPPSSTAPPSQVTTVATHHQKTHKPRRAKRGQETEIPQSSGPPNKVSTSGSGEDSMEHQVDLRDFVPPTPHDSPLSGGHKPGSDEGRPNFNELINLCTQLSNRVLAVENSKTAQDLVIQKLKKRVKRLEKALRARTPGMKLFKIGTSRRKGLDKDNVSK